MVRSQSRWKNKCAGVKAAREEEVEEEEDWRRTREEEEAVFVSANTTNFREILTP